jgi:steroid Delta-isomerase
MMNMNTSMELAPMAPRPAPRGAIPTDPRTARVAAFYEALTPQSLVRLDTVYAEGARFIDPFNDVSGQTAIRWVFEHMFQVLDGPRFQVLSSVTEGDDCFLLWNFRFHRKGNPRAMLIHGSTHVRFAADGRVAMHRDYWDPAREVYEAVPLLGALMRWLRRRLAAPGPG